MVGRSVHLALEHSLDPLFYSYPPLAFYLFGLAEGALGLLPGGHLGPATRVDPTAEVLVARLLSFLSFLLATALLYLAGTRTRGRAAGLLSAACFAVAPLAVRQAHFATTDMLATCLVAAAIWAGSTSRGRAGFLLAGVLCGLAAATKYTSGVGIVFPVCLALLSEDRAARAGSALGGALVAFAAPLLIAAPPDRYLEGLRFLGQRSVASYGSLPIGIIYHPTRSLPVGMGLPILVLSLGGAAVGLARRRATDLSLLAFLGAYLVVVGFSHEVFFRYVLPMLPALCLLAGAMTDLARTPRQAVANGGLAALLLLPSALDSATSDRLLATPDTRQLAAAWLLENAPEGSRLVIDSYWAQPFYDQAELGTRPLHPLYLSGNAVADSFQLGRFTTRFRVDRPGSPCYLVTASGPPAQAPIPTRVPGQVAVFAAYKGPAPGTTGYDPLDSFYLPLTDFGSIQNPGPSIAISEGCPG